MSENQPNTLLQKILSIRWNPFRSKWVTFIVALGVLAIISIGAVLGWYLYTPNKAASEKHIIIQSGSSVKTIARQLADESIIVYPEVFSLLVRFFEQGRNMKAGEYAFSPKINPLEVLTIIANGQTVVHQLTIAEGLMVTQVFKMIAEIDILTGEIPEEVKEGSLLPETYSYQYGDTRASLVKRMQEAMQKTLQEAWEKRVENIPVKTVEEALILASIVEKETGVPEERGRVAGVFVNRLRRGMRLQTDPTVIYALTRGKYVLERALRTKDLAIDSPYNTYLYRGLPPGPIANPGREAIYAALNPEKTKALYFVADGTGGHAFANTLVEHNANVAKWRRVQRENRRKKNGNIR